MTEPKLSLHRKLAQIMYEAERIPKRGRAPAIMGGYPFVQVGDAADYIRKALGASLITMLPTGIRVVGQVDRLTKNGANMTTVDLVTEWTLTDGESGESITFESFGAGADGGDKYSGKASTSAMKYALLTAFLLSTGDDTELGSHEAAAPQTAGDLNAQERERLGQRPPVLSQSETTADGGLIGTAITQGTQDGELRQSPNGWTLPFRVKNGTKSFIVIAENEMAEALSVVKGEVIGSRVTVWGRWSDETIPAKGTKPEIRYRLLHLERIQTPDLTLPAPGVDEPPDDIELIDEAPTVPLGLVG